MTLEEADRLVERLEAPYPERVQRAVRGVTNSEQPPNEQVRALARLADELGLQPHPPPDPLPEIEDDDVHLVCWIAIDTGEPYETVLDPPPGQGPRHAERAE